MQNRKCLFIIARKIEKMLLEYILLIRTTIFLGEEMSLKLSLMRKKISKKLIRYLFVRFRARKNMSDLLATKKSVKSFVDKRTRLGRPFNSINDCVQSKSKEQTWAPWYLERWKKMENDSHTEWSSVRYRDCSGVIHTPTRITSFINNLSMATIHASNMMEPVNIAVLWRIAHHV